MSSAYSFWSDADLHEEPDQLKRKKSALDKKLTPIEIDVEIKMCRIKGSGKKPYEVYLNECTCRDYFIRLKPCKHMYRLAIELEIIKTDIAPEVAHNSYLDDWRNSASQKAYTLEEAIGIIESLPEDCQITLMNLLISIKATDSTSATAARFSDQLSTLLDSKIIVQVEDIEARLRHFSRNDINELVAPLNVPGFKRNMSRDSLVKWCLVTIPEHISSITPDLTPVTVAAAFRALLNNMRVYLRRKYDYAYESHWEGNTYTENKVPWGMVPGLIENGVPPEEWAFPDDEITALLDKYGANRLRTNQGSNYGNN